MESSTALLSLMERLSNCGLVLSSSEKDGNCFFTSVAKNVCNHPEIWESKLRQVGIEHVEMSHALVTKLRQIFVSELTGEREHQYRDFVTCMNYKEEAETFLMDGFYNSEVGNLMPLAMAESLEANIVLFRTDNDKTFFVTPQVTSTHRTLFLVYHPHGSGHYDAALVFQTPPLTTTKPIKCSCGVNKKEQSNSCSKKIHYISRCVCLKAESACTQSYC